MVSQDSRRKRHAKWRLDHAIHEAVGLAQNHSRRCHQAFVELLTACFEKADFVAPKCYRHAHKFLRGLVALSENKGYWLRSPFEWPGCGGGAYQQFASLAQHLMAKQAVPAFMANVWLGERSQTLLQHQRLYKHLALGNHIRGAHLPIKLNRDASAWFYKAPHHLCVFQAIRWSQIRSLGGDSDLASAIVSTCLGTSFKNDSFWQYFFKLLIAQQGLDTATVAPTVDFLHRHQVLDPRQFRRLVPGSRYQTLVRLVAEFQKRNPKPILSWKNSEIRGFRFVPERQHEWASLQWSIEELTDSAQLIEEGRALRHCVASYATECSRGLTTIWSLRSVGSLTEQRRLTIEVDPRRNLICTALGFCNRPPEKEVRAVLEKWAAKEGLSIAKHV